MVTSAFALWNGGKDSHYAVYRARQAGAESVLLVTFIDANTELVLPWGIPPELIVEQARLMGIPIMKVRVTPESYERELRNLLYELRSEGITHGIFDEAQREDVRDWYRSIALDVSIRTLFPLWGIPPGLLIEEQRKLTRSVIISIDRKLSESYLGTDLSLEFIEYLCERGIDPLGTSGEYGTFVCESPLMQGRIVLTHAERHATPQGFALEIDFWKADITHR